MDLGNVCIADAEPMRNLFTECLTALQTPEVDRKINLVRALDRDWGRGLFSNTERVSPIRVICPGRPDRPELVHHRDLKKRKLSTDLGKAILIHAIAHIEFNAINLALDAVYRFHRMPAEYYTDWLSVALDEARHFELLVDRLKEFGFSYGDFPAHNGLWDMAVQTDSDVLLRMSLIPCVFEARGLDVTPPMINRLVDQGDSQSAEVLKIILDEEVRHVAIGQKWFRHECKKRRLDPDKTLVDLINEYLPGRRHGPFNTNDRIAAGFSHAQLEGIYALGQ